MISLKPVPESRLDVIRPLLQSSIEESGLAELSDVNDLMAKIQRGYGNRCMGVYVDDLEKPQHLLILAHMPGLATKALAAFILRIYTLPEARGDTAAFDVMLATAENYARLHGAESLMGSSWIFRGARDISALWKHYGFEPQENTFVKYLT
jgi:hypothetical protein